MNLILLTAQYPFGTVETFLENEIKVLSQRFSKIYIFPITGGDENPRPVPGNVVVSDILKKKPDVKARAVLFNNFFYILKLLLIELLHTNKKKYFLRNIVEITSYLCQNIVNAKCIEQFLNIHKNESFVFYSFWMNDGALTLSILKDRKKIDRFVFRVLGYDLYDERREGGYMPFRYFNFKMTDKVYCISKDGLNYILKKNIFPEKLALSHLSVFDNGVNPFDPDAVFTVVSCSNLIPLKRVHLIIEALRHIEFPIRWVHFGTGPLMNELKELAKSMPGHIVADFRGHATNTAILEFYKNNPVNLFIHLSETEGGAPVALQEAASSGIPLLGTDAGGIPEIVTKETGILIPVDVNVPDVSKIISDFRAGELNSPQFREGVREFWKKNFNANVIYNKLCDELLNLKKS